MTSVIEQETRTPGRFLRLPEMMARTGLSRSTIYARLEQGRFPRAVSLGARAVGWIEPEVEENGSASGSRRAVTWSTGITVQWWFLMARVPRFGT